jgi:hypothetical protein
VAAYYGAKVYEIAIGSIDSGGVTRTGDLTDATKYPSVIAAGYVAEEMYKGRYPTGHMNEVQYYHDRRMLLDATGSDMGKVDDAVRDAYRILSSDEMKSSMKVMVPRLVKTGRIVFDSEV